MIEFPPRELERQKLQWSARLLPEMPSFAKSVCNHRHYFGHHCCPRHHLILTQLDHCHHPHPHQQPICCHLQYFLKTTAVRTEVIMNPMLRPVQMKLIVSTLTFKKRHYPEFQCWWGSIWSTMIQMEISNNKSSEWWTWKGCWTRWSYIIGNITNTNSNKHKTTPPHFWPGRVVLGQICLQTLNSY